MFAQDLSVCGERNTHGYKYAFKPVIPPLNWKLLINKTKDGEMLLVKKTVFAFALAALQQTTQDERWGAMRNAAGGNTRMLGRWRTIVEKPDGVKASSAASECEQWHKEEFRGMMSGIFVTDQARTREMEVSAG